MDDQSTKQGRIQSSEGESAQPDSLYTGLIRDWGNSVAQANEVLIAWLNSLGVATSGQSDEHIKVSQPKPRQPKQGS